MYTAQPEWPIRASSTLEVESNNPYIYNVITGAALGRTGDMFANYGGKFILSYSHSGSNIP